ncbi:cellobiose transport system substrate-binding protein [Allocatelliglobosispora scoriae]|uniref:Cellobiose transport system substrate-binding protein n=1 Tax=Allocatelliglobosispora scoriae TaxID=643052 RepID=A0A841BWM2_9ACTN|nr:extracellular solute-binding protein [Allocatelliglobosispora scoriae]MBB5872554.1 cellobiose transport system substrate-binding protein [Allocatelliglobosispora scoriae]
MLGNVHKIGATVLAAALAFGLVACGDGDDTATGGKTKVVIGTFGEFGYQPLYKEYMAAHPNIEIVERITKTEDHHKNLAAHLATNTGSADIEAIEEGWLGQFKSQPDKFNNLLDLGAKDIQGQWPAWKWQASVGKNGSQIGLGTDVGGMAMCYRTDLFAKAGLPTNRDEVSALWSNWDGYITAGKKYAAAKIKDSSFTDGPAVMYRAILGQADVGLYDTSDNIVVDSNPAVRAAFDKTIEALNAGLSAKIAAWSPDWNAGFQKGRFATIACPSWMMAYIQTQAADAAGKWDIAKIPGGTGNWGGSFLTIPKQSKHAKEAYELAAWLTSPAQQAKVFRDKGNFPSTSTLYSDPVITDFVNPFFSNAPVGKIFSESVATMKAQYLGPKAGDINTAIINALTRVEQGKQAPDAAWTQALAEVKKL